MKGEKGWEKGEKGWEKRNGCWEKGYNMPAEFEKDKVCCVVIKGEQFI